VDGGACDLGPLVDHTGIKKDLRRWWWFCAAFNVGRRCRYFLTRSKGRRGATGEGSEGKSRTKWRGDCNWCTARLLGPRQLVAPASVAVVAKALFASSHFVGFFVCGPRCGFVGGIHSVSPAPVSGDIVRAVARPVENFTSKQGHRLVPRFLRTSIRHLHRWRHDPPCRHFKGVALRPAVSKPQVGSCWPVRSLIRAQRSERMRWAVGLFACFMKAVCTPSRAEVLNWGSGVDRGASSASLRRGQTKEGKREDKERGRARSALLGFGLGVHVLV